MDDNDYYITASEFFDAVKLAFARVYLDDDLDKLDTQKWHPEDMAINSAVIVQSIGAFSSEIIRQRAIEKNNDKASRLYL